jgi:fumarate reductase (CoM/CoB) subunit A
MWRFAPKLTNALGEEFLPRYCPGGIDPLEVIEAKAMSYPFSVRTIAKYLDIAIFKEIMDDRGTENGGIYFDVRHAGAEKLEKLAPITYRTLKNAGVDLAEEKIELGLVVQNFNGGITIDENGFTSVSGLYAAGEVSGGIHGSDRPGGNNLIDTQVFGYRAGKAAAHYALENGNSKIPSSIYEKFSAKMELGKCERELLRNSEEIYYKEMTIVRTDQGLCKVLDFIEENLNENNSLIFRNRLLVGQILAQAELTRKESRGTHYREDYPESDSEWEKRIVISKGTDLLPHVSITDI